MSFTMVWHIEGTLTLHNNKPTSGSLTVIKLEDYLRCGGNCHDTSKVSVLDWVMSEGTGDGTIRASPKWVVNEHKAPQGAVVFRLNMAGENQDNPDEVDLVGELLELREEVTEQVHWLANWRNLWYIGVPARQTHYTHDEYV